MLPIFELSGLDRIRNPITPAHGCLNKSRQPAETGCLDLACCPENVVEIDGFEPTTLCLQSRCSSQLSYTPMLADCKGKDFLSKCKFFSYFYAPKFMTLAEIGQVF